MATRSVTVINPQGLHARPAELIARLASQYRAEVAIVNGRTRANGRSIIDILMLGAAAGTSLTVETAGEDADEALAALVQMIGQIFPEHEPGARPPSPAEGFRG